MPLKPTCKSCHWARFERSATGRIKRKIAGTCTYAVRLPQLPVCARALYIDKHGIWPDTGDCPVFLPVEK